MHFKLTSIYSSFNLDFCHRGAAAIRLCHEIKCKSSHGDCRRVLIGGYFQDIFQSH